MHLNSYEQFNTSLNLLDISFRVSFIHVSKFFLLIDLIASIITDSLLTLYENN